MHQVIASPVMHGYAVVRPGSKKALRVGAVRFEELRTGTGPCPSWLVDAARTAWEVDLSRTCTEAAVLVREPSPSGFVRATHEVNLGCNYDCEHCYLGLKRFEGMSWEQRAEMLGVLRDAGVLWLQLTGGEPLIDRYFPQVYERAYDLGMMISLLTNGSRLHARPILELLTARRPHRITVSVYGATEATYDGLTRRRGAFRSFDKGIKAALEAGLPMAFSLVITRTNEHELDAMRAMAEELGVPYDLYPNMSPTIYGGAEVLTAQSSLVARPRKPFTGCNAGTTFFHVDPHGKASICKIGREPNVDLPREGLAGLQRLGGIAADLLRRADGCVGCGIQGACGTCPPLVKLYRRAKAPLAAFCQHGHPREEEAT